MAKFNKEIVKRICSLIEKDSYTISEICQMVGISETIYYRWKSEKVEFVEEIKKAQDKFNEGMLVECNKSLAKLIKGYTAYDKKTVTADTGKKDEAGKPIVKVKEHAVTEKHIAPSLGAIIHFQTNRDPDNWKNRQENNLSGRVNIRSELEKLTDEELESIIHGESGK